MTSRLASPPSKPSRVAALLIVFATGGLIAAASAAGCGGGDADLGDGVNVESCFNGKDDNNNGAVDCEDAVCKSDNHCVDAIPSGWESLGYVVLALTPEGGTEPTCPAAFPDFALSGVVDPVVESGCSACECSPEGTCELTDLDPNAGGLQAIEISSRACGEPGVGTLSRLDVPTNWDGVCYSPNAFPGGATNCVPDDCNVSVKIGALIPSVTCSPKGGEPLPPTWGATATLCSGGEVGGGCGAGVCRPKAPEGFEPGLCIAQEGQGNCPSPFTTRTLIYQADELVAGACSPCSCDPSSDASCSGQVTLYSDIVGTPCSTEVITVDAGACADLTGNPAIAGRVLELTAPPSATCPAATGGGSPIGGGATGAVTTVCCAPG